MTDHNDLTTPTWDEPTTPPPSPASINDALSKAMHGHHQVTVTITTDNLNAYAMIHQALVPLLTDVLTLDRQADIDFEASTTQRTHFDTHPF